jgi:hypothetical protein
MEFGIFNDFWVNHPQHLPFLSFTESNFEPKSFGLHSSISNLELILKRNSLEDIKKDIIELLVTSNWRTHLVASIALTLLKKENTNDLLEHFWDRINKGSWVVPQLLVVLSIVDSEFRVKAENIINEESNYLLNNSDLNYSRRKVFDHKKIASINYLLKGIVNDTSESDSGASITQGWKQNLQTAINENIFIPEQF